MGGLKHLPDTEISHRMARPDLRACLLALAIATAAASSLPSRAGAASIEAALPIVASTLLGGRSEESVADMAVGPDGSIYLLLQTESGNMPTTPGAFDRSYNRPRDGEFGGDAFVARLRQEVELDSDRADLLEAVNSTVQPAHAGVWLRAGRR